MTKKFLYENDGDYFESESFESSDFISTSAGSADAGKPIVLDASGQLDPSLIDFGDIDHGSLSGLADDDHTQYILVDGSRAFTGDVDAGSNKLVNVANGVLATDGINKSQLDAAIAEASTEGTVFTVGAGGVTKGDLLYVSSDNTVSTMPINAKHYCVGVAATTEAAASTVKALADKEVITGVLTGATAGDKFWWDGTTISASPATGPGTRRWQAGYAINTTDLLIDVFNRVVNS